MAGTEPLLASIVIPTFNGEKYLREILTASLAQRIDGAVEVLVIDSGSTDATLAIVESFPEVRLHQIPNSEFGHGRTRNLAAQLSGGEFVAFLTHDAIPATDRWLHELLAPFSIDPRIVGVMGKQLPRPTCFPLMKYDIQGVFAGFGPHFGTTVFYDDGFVDDPGTLAAITFYSDVNSAARRDILTGQIPYRDVPYAEDQMFGQDVIAAGFRKAYAPRAAVVHSNDLTLAEFGPRIFDETVGLRRIGTVVSPMTWAGAHARAVRGALRDTKTILRDGSYTWRRKLYWIAVNPFYHVSKWRAYRTATLTDLTDEASVNADSLEHRRKTAAPGG
jgi:rhamnosyltransferase